MSFYDTVDEVKKVRKAKNGGGISLEEREEANRRMDLITREMNRLDREKFKALAWKKPQYEAELARLQKELQKLAVFLGGQ